MIIRWEPEKLWDVDRLILNAGVVDLVRLLCPIMVVRPVISSWLHPLSVVEGQNRVGLHLYSTEETGAGERNLNVIENSNFPLMAKYWEN